MQTTKIWLASKSPRRRELLRQIGVEFELLLLRDAPPRGPDVSEQVLPGEDPAHYVARVTREKACMGEHVMQMRHLPPHAVLSADTTVVLHGEILGKPENREHAIAMLSTLSGHTHQVLTGVALAQNGICHQVTQVSDVTFAHISHEEIQRYCDTAEPYDKAGGYGIQGWAARHISHISGSYSGIMGLPLYETSQLLK